MDLPEVKEWLSDENDWSLFLLECHWKRTEEWKWLHSSKWKLIGWQNTFLSAIQGHNAKSCEQYFICSHICHLSWTSDIKQGKQKRKEKPSTFSKWCWLKGIALQIIWPHEIWVLSGGFLRNQPVQWHWHTFILYRFVPVKKEKALETNPLLPHQFKNNWDAVWNLYKKFWWNFTNTFYSQERY